MESETKWLHGETPGEDGGKGSLNKRPSETDNVGIILGGLVLVFIIWSIFFSGQSSSDKPRCTGTTKTFKTIEKVDGRVVSVSSEDVSGCVTDDGFFISAPWE